MARKTHTEAQARYDKVNRRVYGFRLHNEIDSDIIAKLASVDSMQGYIKQLIREDIARTCSVPKVEKWIPCSEKLPCEKTGTVLISMPNDKVKTGKYSEFSQRWYKGDMCAIGGDDPVAWMPLPNAYK